MTSLPLVALHTTSRSCPIMVIIGTHMYNAGNFGSVVACENNQSIGCYAQFIEAVKKLSGNIIELINEIAMRTGFCRAFELWSGKRWQMYCLTSMIQEECFIW